MKGASTSTSSVWPSKSFHLIPCGRKSDRFFLKSQRQVHGLHAMCRIQAGLWPYTWGGPQNVRYCRENGKGLGGAEGGLGGLMGDSHGDMRLHEANDMIPEECDYDHAADRTGVGAGG